MAGQEAHRFNISNVTNTNPAVVTTSTVHDYVTGNFVRIMDLNGSMPTHRGSDQVNYKRFAVVVLDTSNFQLKDPITKEFINSIDFTPYVSGGNVNLVEFDFIYSGT